MIGVWAAGRPEDVAADDAARVQRMLMEWYATDTARAPVRSRWRRWKNSARPERYHDQGIGRLPG